VTDSYRIVILKQKQTLSSVLTEEDPYNIPKMEGCPYPTMIMFNIESGVVHKPLQSLNALKLLNLMTGNRLV